MRIVVCVKEVLDPDAVNNYVLSGNLKIGEDGKTLDASAVPRLMNGYDEQALEAAQRIRDAGADCSITAVTIGKDAKALLKSDAIRLSNHNRSQTQSEVSRRNHSNLVQLAAHLWPAAYAW